MVSTCTRIQHKPRQLRQPRQPRHQSPSSRLAAIGDPLDGHAPTPLTSDVDTSCMIALILFIPFFFVFNALHLCPWWKLATLQAYLITETRLYRQFHFPNGSSPFIPFQSLSPTSSMIGPRAGGSCLPGQSSDFRCTIFSVNITFFPWHFFRCDGCMCLYMKLCNSFGVYLGFPFPFHSSQIRPPGWDVFYFFNSSQILQSRTMIGALKWSHAINMNRDHDP